MRYLGNATAGGFCGSGRVSRTPNVSVGAPHLAVEESDESGDGFGNFDGIVCLRIGTGSFDQQHVAAEDLAPPICADMGGSFASCAPITRGSG